MRLTRAAAVVILSSVCVIAAAVVASIACIPDLPADSAGDGASAADGGDSGDAPPVTARCGDGIIQLGRGEQCDPGAATVATCSAQCQMTCAAAGYVWPRNNHCYSLYPTKAVSLDQEAAGDCSQSGAHVATFGSEAERAAVVDHLGPDAFWVGLDPVEGQPNGYTPLQVFEPGWSTTCPGCFAQTAIAASPLPGTPQGCVEALWIFDASWQQYPCSDAGKIHVVCEREPVGVLSARCDGGVCIDLAWTFGQKRYLYGSNPKRSADDAQQYCVGLGGSLVVLQSRDEREQLWRELSRMAGFTSPPAAIWIGLSLVDGAWVWADDAGADAYPPPWAQKQPSDAGSHADLVQTTLLPAVLDTTLAHAEPPGTSLPFVCQLPGTDAGP